MLNVKLIFRVSFLSEILDHKPSLPSNKLLLLLLMSSRNKADLKHCQHFRINKILIFKHCAPFHVFHSATFEQKMELFMSNKHEIVSKI